MAMGDILNSYFSHTDQLEMHQYLVNVTNNGAEYFKLTETQKLNAQSNIKRAKESDLLTRLRSRFEKHEDIFKCQAKVNWISLPITRSSEDNLEISVIKHSLLFGRLMVMDQEESTIPTVNAECAMNTNDVDGTEVVRENSAVPEVPLDLSQESTHFPLVQREKTIEDCLNEIARLRKEIEEKDEQVRFMSEQSQKRALQYLPYSPCETTALLKAVVAKTKDFRRCCYSYERIATEARALDFWGNEDFSVKTKYEGYMKRIKITSTTTYRSPNSLKQKWRNMIDGIATHDLKIFNQASTIKLEDQQILVRLARECCVKKSKSEQPILSKPLALMWNPNNLLF